MSRRQGKRYWLMKTEPDVFSIEDLKNAPGGQTHWDGVRNYQARNYMRDEMKLGDKVLVYHSNADPSCVVGVATICKEAYPDHTAWDPQDPHYDPKTSQENPRWMMVDIEYEATFPRPLSLAELREVKKLAGMVLLQKGTRLSVQPVTQVQYETILKLANAPAPSA